MNSVRGHAEFFVCAWRIAFLLPWMESWCGGEPSGARAWMEMVRVTGIETLRPWSFKSSVRVLGQRRKIEGMRTHENEKGDRGGRLGIFKTENDWDLWELRGGHESGWTFLLLCNVCTYMWVEEEEALAVEEEVEAHDKPLRFGNRWVYGIKEGSKFLVSFPFLHVRDCWCFLFPWVVVNVQRKKKRGSLRRDGPVWPAHKVEGWVATAQHS